MNPSRMRVLRERTKSFGAYVGRRRERLLAILILGAVLVGGILYVTASPESGRLIWALGLVAGLVPLSYSVARSLLRGDVGVDLIALVAMAGSLLLGEYLAGVVIALMLSGGGALETVAVSRARKELTTLLERAPKVAHRRRGEDLEEVPVEELETGDVVVVRAGEVIPVDGILLSRTAVVDESALTGEPLPVSLAAGSTLRSGAANAGDAFDMRTTRPAAESAYAQIVKLVREAERQKAPFVRLADRYALFFLPLTAAVAGGAWLMSGEPVRALAVFVVATPCPLILAAPIALISGLSRAAHHGIILKGASAIEKLGRARTVILDKTGTVTLGTPEIEDITPLDGTSPLELLRLAASVDQLSAHVLAEAIVHGAKRRGLRLTLPEEVIEDPGQGIEGYLEGHRVAVGSPAWLRERGYGGGQIPHPSADDAPGRSRILVGMDGRVAGSITMGDRLREDAKGLVGRLHAAGIEHVVLATGDSREVAAEVGERLGVDEIHAGLSPEDKLKVVREAQESPSLRPVVMVGDGVNDAPALALADVGVAMGSAGSTVSSETADAVITVDRIDRVVDAILIGRRSFGIARQSVVSGMGMSLAAMLFAAFGYIEPVEGALLQEGIDLAVILNALRALRAA